MAALIGDAEADKVADWLGYFEREETASPAGESASLSADPVDLWAKFDPPALPRGVLPEVIEAFAFDQGMTMGGDMSGVAVVRAGSLRGGHPR